MTNYMRAFISVVKEVKKKKVGFEIIDDVIYGDHVTFSMNLPDEGCKIQMNKKIYFVLSCLTSYFRCFGNIAFSKVSLL